MTRIRCHPFTVCPRDGVRHADGSEIALRPKTWAVLSYLIEHRDRPVSKDELLANVWDGLVVHEQAVFQSVSEIRTALKPLRCIQTLRGRGYRWVAAEGGAVSRLALVPRVLGVCATLLLGLLVLAGDSRRVPLEPVQLQLVAVQSALLPGALVAKALPQVEVGADGATARSEGARLVYRLDLRGDRAVLRYRLQYRSELVSGSVSGNLNTLVHDLAERIEPLLWPGADAAQLARIYRDFPGAVSAVEEGRHAEASARFESLLQAVPEYAPALIGLSELALQAGDHGRARALATRVLNAVHPAARNRARSRAQLVLAQVGLADEKFAVANLWAARAAQTALAGGDLYLHALAQETLAGLALAQGDRQRARRQLRLSHSLYVGFCPVGTQRVAQRLKDLGESATDPQRPRI